MNEDFELDHSVVNSLYRLKNKCYQELINQQEPEYESQPVDMLHHIPNNITSLAWNGSHFFYVGSDKKTLFKCAGNVNRADFGKEIFLLKFNFKVNDRRRSFRDKNTQIKIAANSSHVFCTDDTDIFVFD